MYKEYRKKRRDCTQHRVNQFGPQMETLVDAYMAWSAKEEYATAGEVKTYHNVKVIEVFSSYSATYVETSANKYIATALVCQGLFPCSPILNVAVSTATLELYHSLFVWCPRLPVQPFVKTLCDLLGIPFQHYLATQFSLAFDIYLEVLSRTRQRVAVTLDRHGPNWYLVNACPACLYELEDEEHLKYSMFFTMDSNNSLKRMHWHERFTDELGQSLGESRERPDPRKGGGDYFLLREEVDEWHDYDDPAQLVETSSEEGAGCDSWHNAKENNTKAMWWIYDETGVFLSLCRHDFVLLITNMVNSGELRKYALSILARFFGVLPK
ncbi:hypothetical protein C8J56DRAFT_1063400 [Mycena floridula]|nr:hypothetical protein C8J56DRAFT_1063400 [Mycena floridula]